ncbi:MAG: TlpA disulfide reductase family protein [Bacteroidetes bacterium]|nr:TlpA disulfide reductase family protein [Bacteroidota bacterium]
MKKLLFLIFFPFSLLAAAQTTKITGTAPGAEGKRIEVITALDLLTGLEKTLVQATVDSTASFTLTLNSDHILFAYLAIDFHRGELFIEPGRTYNLSIAPLNYNEIQEVNPFVESQSLEITILENKPDDLNSLIQSFNKEYNVFVLENFNYLYQEKDRARLDTFRVKMDRKFADGKKSYFHDYACYKLGSLEQVANVMGKSPMVKKYFSDAPILYGNVEYMDFFKEFFSRYITTTSRPLKFLNYAGMLKDPNSFPVLMKALEADTLLRKPQLRELVLLRCLMEMYDDPAYTQPGIQNTLNLVVRDSKFPENRIIAEDLIKYLTRLRRGSAAPEFTLQDRYRKKVSLRDFRGKPVLLSFWTTYCQKCLSEMEMVKPLYDKYRNGMTFVSISADKEFVKMLFFLNLKKDFSWTFLHLGSEFGLLREYDVRAFPLFVLIDSQGRIVQYPADLPDAGLESSLEKLLNP